MKIKLKYLILLITGILCSCNSGQTNKGRKVKYTRDGHAIVSFYSGDGVLEYEVSYINGDTILDGVTKAFYPNGKIKAVFNYEKGKRKGLGIQYYLNKHIKEYGVADPDAGVFCLSKYDSLGKPIIHQGRVFSPHYSYWPDSTDSLRAGHGFKTWIWVCKPPNTKIKIRLGEMNILNNEEKISFWREIDTVEKNQIELGLSYNKPGIYREVAVAELMDLNGEIIKRDTLKMEFRINPLSHVSY